MTKVTICAGLEYDRARAIVDPDVWQRHRSHPRFQPEFCLLALAEDKPVGAALINHTRWRRQRARFEVADVTIIDRGDPAIIEALLAAAADVAAMAGLAWLRCHLAPGVAQRWGMVAATLIGQVAWAGGTNQVAPATSADLADLLALGLDAPAPQSVSRLRYEPDWRWQLVYNPPLALRDRREQVIGYVELTGNRVLDGRAVDAAAARALLEALPATAHELWVAPDHPLAQTAVELGATLTARRADNDSIIPLWSVIHPLAALAAHQDALTARLTASAYSGWNGSVTLEGEWGTVSLICAADGVKARVEATDSDITLHHVSSSGLAELLLGRRSASDLSATGDLRCARSELALLDILFPAAR